MKTSCISHPQNEPMIIIRQWQVEYCRGNRCAAALLSFFEYWHSVRLTVSDKARQANVIAEKHGEDGQQDTSLFQFHNEAQLGAGVLGLYGKSAIAEAIKELIQLGAISVHKNPNPRYCFDSTRHFLFYPEIPQRWLNSRQAENSVSQAENSSRQAENSSTSPETTSETTSEKKKEAHLSETNSPIFLTHKKRKLSGILLTWFEEFWEAFAFRHGKAAAADAYLDQPWGKQLKSQGNPEPGDCYPHDPKDQELRERIKEAAIIEAKRRQSIIARGGTPKWAQGWLSERRYEDEGSPLPPDPRRINESWEGYEEGYYEPPGDRQ